MNRFLHELGSRIPSFRRCGPEAGAGESPMWAWNISPDLVFFVKLQLLESKDHFAVELAWSDDGIFPWKGITNKVTTGEKGRFRLRPAPPEPTIGGTWPVVPEESLEQLSGRIGAMVRGSLNEALKEVPLENAIAGAPVVVKEAIQRLVEHGLPLLRKVAEHRGVDWPADVVQPI